jgi:hypothetical protein
MVDWRKVREMGSRMEFLELKVDREAGETIEAIAAELGLPMGHVVSIALVWFADVMCTPEGSVGFTEWLEDHAKDHGWYVPLAG